jgi:predicted PurR-regulated permease PerM
LLLEQLRPESQERVNAIWNDVEAKVGDWLRGQMILCLIIGVAAGIGYGLLGLKFWILLAVFAGITELIPIIGPWIGGIPAFVVALLDSWEKAAVVAVFLILLQFTENSILVPRVMKGAIGLSPLTVFLAVLAGGQFMGPLGALLAIPLAAAIQVIISDAIRMRRQQSELDAPVDLHARETHTQRWRSVLTQFLHDDRGHPPVVPADPSEPPVRAERARSIDAPPNSGDS